MEPVRTVVEDVDRAVANEAGDTIVIVGGEMNVCMPQLRSVSATLKELCVDSCRMVDTDNREDAPVFSALCILRIKNPVDCSWSFSPRTFPNLRVLHLQHLNLRIFPVSVYALKSTLRELNVSFNEFTQDLPEDMGRELSELEHLDMSGCRITKLPNSTLRWRCLTTLNVSDNRLLDLPYTLGGCDRMEVLDISFNFVESLPSSMQQMKRLRVLRASNNRIESLPPWLSTLSNLETLDVRSNRLPACVSVLSTHPWPVRQTLCGV
jgi:Leucine-rich repeat (LRR) protein